MNGIRLVSAVVLSLWFAGAALGQDTTQGQVTPANGTTQAQSPGSTPSAKPASKADSTDKTQNKSDADSTKLNAVIVEGTDITPTDIAEQDLAKIPGGTNLIKSAEAEQGRVSTAADLFKGQPGIFAQSAGGTDAIKLSIRGSGVNRGTGYFRTGALFTFDGLPVTGPSGTPYELFEPLGLQYTEVYRGVNAFDTGALALGGAVNYVTPTGYTASPFEARFEAGSFNYFKGQLASGLVSGPFDYYVSATGSHRDGYQDHSDSATNRYSVNLGYQINPDVETRLYFRFGWTYFDNPGQLTVNQIEQDPSQANPNYLKYNSHRTQPGSTWVGSKTTVHIDQDSKLEFGLAYQNFPILIQGGSSATVIPSVWQYGNLAPHITYTRSDQIFDKESDSTLAFYSSTDIYGNVVRSIGQNETINGQAYTQGQIFTINDFSGSSDNVLLASNDTEILPDLWLTSGISGVFIRRNIDITYPVTVNYDSQRFDYKPELALRYNITPDVQVYDNISRSVEPRNDWEGILTQQNKAGLWQVLDLKQETAWTEEFGVKFKSGIFSGTADYYYSAVNNELLSVNDPTTGITTEENATPTTHQGVELGLNTVLWQDGRTNEQAAKEPTQRIVLNQAYTWSDFYYNNDPTEGHHKLPGIPVDYYFGELRYEHPSGFYAGFNTQAASSYALDYANSVNVPPYVIFGTTIGYESPKKGFSAYLDFRNLTNKHYAADVSSPAYNVGGSSVAAGGAVLDPGDGFGVFSGISYKF